MLWKFAASVALGASVLTFGQSAEPTTRPSTAGTIAHGIGGVGPLRNGANVPAVTLVTSDGAPFDLRKAVSEKPTVLVFYRGGWCKNCTRQLSGIEGVLQDLGDAGYQVLGISPDKPERLRITIEDFKLTYALLSDSDAAAMKAFGLAHVGLPSQFEMLEKASGATHHALPVPSIYIIGTDGTIRFAHLDPDYTNKLGYSDLVERAKAALLR